MNTGSRRCAVLPALAMLLTVGTATAAESPWQPHASILAAARATLKQLAGQIPGGRVEIHVGRLDPRVRLRRCRQPLEAEPADATRTRGNTTVIVRCPDESGWRIHVTGRIDVFEKVVVLGRSLARGERLTPDMLELRERNTAVLQYGYFRSPREVTGRVARRALPAGTVLTPGNVAAPVLVRRGERVTLIATRGAVSVRMQGKALRDGSRGDRVQVRNLRSKRVVEGEVVARGVVKMTL